MSLFRGYVLAPALLGALVLGLGLLVERLFGLRLVAQLVPPLGFATLIVVAGLLTLTPTTARAATPICAALAVVGVVVTPRWSRLRSARGELPAFAVIAGVAFALYVLPTLATGNGSIAGYFKLDDSATWLALTDRVMEHGRDITGLAPSSYSATLRAYLGGDYPVGAFLPLGVASRLAGVDAAGAYQSTIAVYAAILALGLAGSVRQLLTNRWACVVAALVAVQASLFFGYLHLGGIKEAATAALLSSLGWMLAGAWRQDAAWRTFPAVCLVSGALFGVLGINAVTWVGPALAVASVGLAFAVRKRRRGGVRGRLFPARSFIAAAGVVVLLTTASLPAIVTIGFARFTAPSGVNADQRELGNLRQPLSLFQGAGLWPAGDFRNGPDRPALAYALATICLVSGGVAVVAASRRGTLALPVLVGVALAGAVPAIVIGSPWVDAKALAIVSPVVLLAAVALPLDALATPRVPILATASALIVILVVGAAWSTWAAAGSVWTAPGGSFVELLGLSRRLAGRGPVVVLDFDSYAARHFLRRADPEGATDLRDRRVERYDGTIFPRLTTAEVDYVATDDLFVYRAIVRRRSPGASRPPSAYRLAYAGRFWEMWERDDGRAPRIERLPLGEGADPTGVPACRDIRALARSDDARRLVALERRSPVIAPLDTGTAPPSWLGHGLVAPDSDGTLTLDLDVPDRGRYRVWVGGSVLGRLDVSIDGRAVGAAQHQIAHGGQWIRFGTIDLRAGSHRAELRYSRRLIAGAFSDPPPPLGPFALSPVGDEEDLAPIVVAPRQAATLCDGRRFDWIEAVR